MNTRDFFVTHAVRQKEIEDFISCYFPRDSFSRINLERTPLGIKITIYTANPGRIIGAGGKKINELTDTLKTRFEMENPQLDVKVIDNPFLDARTIATRIANAIERGINHKKIANTMIRRIMEAGAIGVEIRISGKLGGSEKAKSAIFTDGYVKKCGEIAKVLVDEAFKEAMTKPGKIGIRVMIMKTFPEFIKEVEHGNTKEK